MIQQFSFDGSGRQIDAKGVFFRYESGTDGSGVVDIRLTIDGQQVGTFSPGDSLDLPTPVRRWEIVPVSAGCVGVVKIGNARVTSPKLQGVVQTVDGGRARSLSGQAFSTYGLAIASAGQVPHVQLWNQSSDRNLIVNGFTFVSNNSNGMHARASQTPIAAGGNPAYAKRVGLPNSSAAVAKMATGVFDAFGLPAAAYRFVYVTTASQTQQYRPVEPLVISPGWGLTITGSSIGGDAGVTFEWFEESA